MLRRVSFMWLLYSRPSGVPGVKLHLARCLYHHLFLILYAYCRSYNTEIASAAADNLSICDLLHVDTLHPIGILSQLVDIQSQTNPLNLPPHKVNKQPLDASPQIHRAELNSHPSSKNSAPPPPLPPPSP